MDILSSMINRRSRAGMVDFSEGDNDDSIKSYCKHCLSFGFSVPLKNRIYPQGEPIPSDSDQFLQCHECGLIVPIYEIEKESMIKDVVETSDNPFDVAKNEFLGIDRRTSVGGKNARKKKERQKQLDEITDENLKAELAKGNTLISYSEYMPQ
jgi:hypothetical protein